MNCILPEKLIKRFYNQYGSPLYIFHKDKFIDDYNKLLDEMRKYYPKYNIAYSYKTNYTPRICRIVKDMGGLAEVVSEMEYELAKRIGYDDKDIVFNGPVKGDALEKHLLGGGVTNIDSIDELRKVIALADQYRNNDFNIAFRVNIDIGQSFISRFGLDAYEDEQQDSNSELSCAFRMVMNHSNVKVVGLHCHVGQSRSVRAWEKRVQTMFVLTDRYFNEPPAFLDFGSGMNSDMEPTLANQFGENIPTFAEYAEILGQSMKKKYGNLAEVRQPSLYTEPGTTLIAGSVSFLARVNGIKKVKGKEIVTFDCSGGNMGDICRLKRLPISVYHMGGELQMLSEAAFVGYTCLEHDHIYEDFTGEIAVGDLIQFRNVGGYSNVFKPPFILPNCAMIEMSRNEESKLIKFAESFDDIFHTYVF